MKYTGNALFTKEEVIKSFLSEHPPQCRQKHRNQRSTRARRSRKQQQCSGPTNGRQRVLFTIDRTTKPQQGRFVYSLCLMFRVFLFNVIEFVPLRCWGFFLMLLFCASGYIYGVSFHLGFSQSSQYCILLSTQASSNVLWYSPGRVILSPSALFALISVLLR